MNQGKLEMVKQTARMNIDILGISELKWTELDKAVEEEGAIEGGVDLACTAPLGIVIAREMAAFGRLLPRRKDVWFSQAKDVPKYRWLLYLQS